MDVIYFNNILLEKEVHCELRGAGNTGWEIRLGELKETEVKMCVIRNEEFGKKAIDLYFVIDDKWFPVVRNVANTKTYYERLCSMCDEFIKILSKLASGAEDAFVIISTGIPTYDMLSKISVKYSLIEDKSVSEHIESDFKFVQEEIDRTKKSLDIVLARNCMFRQ